MPDSEISQENPETITLEFMRKGFPGPTLSPDTNSYLIELHYKGSKYLLNVPRQLTEILPSFSILKIRE